VGYQFPEPEPSRPGALLRALNGSEQGREYPIENVKYRIGTDSSNELQLSDSYVSRKHASIEYESGTFYLRDIGSRNGTFLNGLRIDETAVLHPGDEIRVGKTIFKLEVSPQ
jgi:pSer/pThr/pTyr-binding forkhead associated (FHA) protein